MNISRSSIIVKIVLFSLFAFIFAETVPAQSMDRIERSRMKAMLKNIKNEIKKEYYDPNFHGIDLEARFDQAEARLDEVQTVGQSLGVIAQALMDFDDSHLYFYPPSTDTTVEYGWRAAIVGNNVYINHVKPNSDAEKQGIKPGDLLVGIEGFRPNKKELGKMLRYFNVLSKRTKLRVSVLSPGAEKPRDLLIDAKVKKVPKTITKENFALYIDTAGQSDSEYNYFKSVGSVMIWKLPTFGIDPSNIDMFMGKVENSPNLILDLRRNGGGLVVTLERLAGFMFDKDLTIATLRGRKEMDPITSKTKGDKAFKGKLVVLVDAHSGSASEIFARLVQLEKRGVVVGDVSAGAVMQSRSFITSTGSSGEVYYGASITNADVIMSDGKSIEHVGVTPDELVVPTGEDIAKRRDPALAKALEILGVNVSPAEAGSFFTYKWTKDDVIEIDVK